MPRYRLPYSIIKRPDSRYYYFNLGTWTAYKSTGTSVIDDAEKIAQEAYVKSLMTSVVTAKIGVILAASRALRTWSMET